MPPDGQVIRVSVVAVEHRVLDPCRTRDGHPSGFAAVHSRRVGSIQPVSEIHDNWLYGQSIDHERRLLVLHTVYPHTGADPWQYTDVVFEGVVVHHFDYQSYGGGGVGGVPANVLFGVEEVDARFLLEPDRELLKRTKAYGWPVNSYEGLDDLIAQLTADGARGFEVHGSVGLAGFVFARSMEFRSRPSRADVAGDLNVPSEPD